MDNVTGKDSTLKKHNWLKIIGLSVLGFVVFVIAIIALVFQAGSAPMKASETFLMQLSSNQIEPAYESASIQFKQSVTKGKFLEFITSYPVLTRVEKSSFNSFNIQNDSFATVSGIIKATDGQISPINLQLVNENGAWRVLNLDLNQPAPTTDSTVSTSDDLDF